jgi:hypothetical protein
LVFDKLPAKDTRCGVNRLNPTAVFLVGTVIVLAALFLPGPIGGVMLLAVAAVAAVMTAGTWSRLPLVGRGARLVILAILVAGAVKRLL